MRKSIAALLGAGLLLATASGAARAYTPGSGTLLSENFNGTLSSDWENGDNVNSSPWTQVTDGTDKSFYADGKGSLPGSPTRHWSRHWLHPTDVTTFSIALEFRSELGAGYAFDVELEQRAPALKKYRMRVDLNGRVSLWRTEAGTFVQQAATAGTPVPLNTKRWIRFAIEPDASGHPRVRARVWGTSAASEPTTWNVDFVDANDTLARVHRFELVADGTKGKQTWIDDLDLFGGSSTSGVASSVKTIYLMEASHLDIGFTLPPDDIESYAKTHLDQVLANLDADPQYRWTIEESWYLDRWWERSSETARQNMLAHLRAGKLRLAAGYATLHSTTAGQEELIRSIYFAKRLARQYGGFTSRLWISDDVPGTSFALPEILARSGIEFYVGGMNTPFGGKLVRPNHGDRPFWWVGPDGSRVLSWITFDSYAEAFDYGFSWFDSLADLYTKLGKKLPEQEEAGYRFPELLMMRAFDNNYAGFKARDLVDQWNATYDAPKFVLATAEEFFDHMLAAYGPGAFPTFAGDFGCAWSPSHAQTPQTESLVRQAHRDGRSAEAAQAVASLLDGAPVPQASFDTIYRNQLQVDEHSGGGGWPGYWNLEQLDRNDTIHFGYAKTAQSTAAALLAQGADRIAAAVPASEDAIVAFNPLGFARDGWVRVALPAPLYASAFRVVEQGSGTELPYQRFDASSEIMFRAAAVPAVGYRAYHLVPGAPTAVAAGVLTASGTLLENDIYRLDVGAASGAVTSLIDKRTGRQLIDVTSGYRFNELASSVSQDVNGNVPPLVNAPAGATVSVGAVGAAVAELKVTRSGSAHVATTYRLFRGEDRVEIENTLDRTKMPYVTNAVGTRAYTVTLPFAVSNFSLRSESTTRFVDPPADRFNAANQVFDYHNVEHTLAFWDANQGIQYAVDAADSHSFEHFSGFPAAQYTTGKGLVLTRMVDKNDEYEFADGSIGPYEIEPGASPITRFTHHVRSTAPSFDAPGAARFGYAALTPLVARYLAPQAGTLPADAASFFAADAPNVMLYTVKGAETGDGTTLRMIELAGVPATTVRVWSDAFAIDAAWRVGHDESGATPLALDAGAALVPVGAYETATIRLQAARPPATVSLAVSRVAASGAIHLQWTGGVAPFTLVRAEDPQFTTGVTTLVDHQPVTSFDDPAGADAKTYFYDVH